MPMAAATATDAGFESISPIVGSGASCASLLTHSTMSAITAGSGAVFGLQLPIQTLTETVADPWEASASVADLVAIARRCDERGFGFVGVCDHVAIPDDDYAKHMTTTWYDTVATLGFLAAHTRQIRLLSTIWVAAYRHLLGDWQPYLYRTADYGKTWTRLTTGSNGIPSDDPTRVVREDPSREGLLYAGTEFGLFLSFDDGATWQPFQQNLPITPVTDIVVHQKDLALSTMGRSFWILDELSPLHQLPATPADAPAHLFAPRDPLRLRYAGGSGFGLGVSARDPSDPEYPPPGMYLDYTVARAPSGAVALEVLDRAGQLLRRFSSDAPGDRLPKTTGHHRFRWDFALPGPWDANPERSGRQGPWVVPGPYQARLTVGDWTATTRFRLLPDPRVVRDGVTQLDLEQQLATAVAARELVSDVRRLAKEVAEARKQADTPALAGLAATLTADSTRYPTPRLVEQTGFLYNMTNQADQRLGKDVTDRLVELKGLITKARAEFEAARRGG